jgi:hypothetical protein
MESQIEKLKEKYWEGASSVEEEKLLWQLLSTEDKTGIDKGYFEELSKRKNFGQDIVFEHPERKNRLLMIISSVAATIIILVGLLLGLGDSEEKNQFAIDDPRQAYEISQKALLFVSAKLNKGKDYSVQMEKINEVKKMVTE